MVEAYCTTRSLRLQIPLVPSDRDRDFRRVVVAALRAVYSGAQFLGDKLLDNSVACVFFCSGEKCGVISPYNLCHYVA